MTSIKESTSRTPDTLVVKGKRPMHQSTLLLGDQTKPVYTTTHAQSFGRDGQPLVFMCRDAPCSSQHNNGELDLSNVQATLAKTHSRDVHDLKDLVPHQVLHRVGEQNKRQNRGGVVMKDVINSSEVAPYQTTYHTEHCRTPSRHLTCESSGQPVHWHRHNIITGEEVPAGPGEHRRQSGERVLWAVRRWEKQHDSFRLY